MDILTIVLISQNAVGCRQEGRIAVLYVVIGGRMSIGRKESVEDEVTTSNNTSDQ
jgi:hypothetical protein